jgi:hypothetical protein
LLKILGLAGTGSTGHGESGRLDCRNNRCPDEARYDQPLPVDAVREVPRGDAEEQIQAGLDDSKLTAAGLWVARKITMGSTLAVAAVPAKLIVEAVSQAPSAEREALVAPDIVAPIRPAPIP